MKCPYCGFTQDKVIDSRESKDADSIRRRREKFDRQKVLAGLLHSCQKRKVSVAQMQSIVDSAEAFVVDSPERERSTTSIGELIMHQLREIDTVAYIRFASVYRDFKDVNEFKEELEGLLRGKDTKPKRHNAR